jgi:hypothetical protein
MSAASKNIIQLTNNVNIEVNIAIIIEYRSPSSLLTILKNYFCLPETNVPIAYAVVVIIIHMIILIINTYVPHQLYFEQYLFISN